MMEHSPYPAITICIKEPYWPQEVAKYNVTISQYEKPEFGKVENISRMYEIPYSKITLDKSDSNFELRSIIYLKNNSVLYYKFKPNALGELRDKYYKCFTFDLTDVPAKINKVELRMKIRNWHRNSTEAYSYMHLPGLFRGARKHEIISEKKLKSSSYERIVESMEVSQLRNTWNHPCDPAIENYDQLLVGDIIDSIGCKPYYIQEDIFSDAANCSKPEQITELSSLLEVQNTFSIFKDFR